MREWVVVVSLVHWGFSVQIKQIFMTWSFYVTAREHKRKEKSFEEVIVLLTTTKQLFYLVADR